MAYQQPVFGLLHAARAAGVGALSGPAAASGFPISRLADGRIKDPYVMASATTSADIELDRGASGLEVVNRLLIPSGHNLAAATIEVQSDDDGAGFPSPTTIYGPTAVSTSGLINVALTPTQERWLRLRITGPSTAWELTEVIYTNLRPLATGIAHGWERPALSSIAFSETEGGAPFVRILAEQRRFWIFEHTNLQGADLAIYDDLQALGLFVPFAFTPPDDAQPVRLMELVEDMDVRQVSTNPLGTGPRYLARLRLREVIA